MAAEVCEGLSLHCPRIVLSVCRCLTCTHTDAFDRHIFSLTVNIFLVRSTFPSLLFPKSFPHNFLTLQVSLSSTGPLIILFLILILFFLFFNTPILMFTIFLCVKVLICLLSPGGPVLNLGANQLACHRRLILPLVLKCRLSLRRSHDGEVITSKILMSHWLMHQSVNIHIVSWANLRPVCIKEAPNLVACVNRGHFVVSCEEVWAGGKWFHCGWFVLFCWKSHLLQYKTTVNPSCGSVDVGSSQYMWMLSSTARTHVWSES